ncbi:hypothetical protein EHS25_006556 [Saitozyma podzolica]|uniref:Hemerythrin-like domain-containing protein n=1 Tax=Saitozyma podzolica TaxID=1890683 RepID=A0A427YS03_9TREE|nr:hypothetical protein EHS25_006556 [Saitozyma podzolica]
MLERSYAFAQWAVDNDDLANYLGYVEVALFNIVSHHAFEEEEIFPFMVKTAGNDIWSRNVAEHHIFSEALDATWLYVRHCRAALTPAAWPPTPVPEPNDAIKSIDMTRYSADLDMSKPFDPAGFRRHIDGFMPSLIEHLRDEIDTLAPDLIEPMGQQADDELKKIVQSHLRGYDPKWFLCSAFTAAPMSTIKQLMALPFLVRRILVPFVFGPKYIGFWRYSAYPENLSWAATA